MDPLMVAGCLGKSVNARLIDGQPFALAELCANRINGFLRRSENKPHRSGPLAGNGNDLPDHVTGIVAGKEHHDIGDFPDFGIPAKRLLGGEGHPLGKTRPLTAIEQGLMERVVEKCCQELAGVWNPLFEMDFQLQAIEGNPELARVIGPNEMVVLVSMELRMNEVSGVMTLCLPYIVMEPAIQRLSQSNMVTRKGGGDPERLRSALSRSVRDSRVRVDVEIGRACLSIRELMELEPGDVLRFSAPCRAGATLLIEGVTRAEGSPGRANGNLALRVDSARDRGQEEKG